MGTGSESGGSKGKDGWKDGQQDEGEMEEECSCTDPYEQQRGWGTCVTTKAASRQGPSRRALTRL